MTWWESQRKRHELFVSPEVLAELSAPTYPHSARALAMTVEAALLPITEEVQGLAKILVGQKVMPGPESSGDAVHVSAAIVAGMEYLVSWNVRNLANLNKVEHLRVICRRLGYIPPAIVTVEGLWNDAEGS